MPPVPLRPIPAVGELFERVLVDCIGPLPKTKSGSQYILTIMCVVSRFPEAIPLRKITAKSVTKALIKFFLLRSDYQRLFKLIKVRVFCLKSSKMY